MERHYFQLAQKFKDQSGKILCRLCFKDITILYGSSGSKSNPAMNRAVVHLKKPIYRCRICSITTAAVNNMRDHIKSRHRTSSIGKYEDKSDKFHSEILNILSKCYKANWRKPFTTYSLKSYIVFFVLLAWLFAFKQYPTLETKPHSFWHFMCCSFWFWCLNNRMVLLCLS